MIQAFYKESQPLQDRVFPGEQRKIDGWLRIPITLACIALTLVTLYFAFTITIGEVRTRGLHLFITVPVTMLLYPAFRRTARNMPGIVDWILAAAAAASFAWAFVNFDLSREDPVRLMSGHVLPFYAIAMTALRVKR